MMTFPPTAKVYLAIMPVDFRKHAKGLKKWVQNVIELDPFSGAYFLFLAKNKKAIKVLHYDGQGICLYWKILSQGKFRGWEKLHDIAVTCLPAHPAEGQVILMNGNSRHLNIQGNWREFS